jgi:uncharacterized protein
MAEGVAVTLLLGVVGPRAHGLEHDFSDTDRRGVYAEPTERILGLDGPPPETRRTDGNVLWEARQAIKLALYSNPFMMELLSVPDYETATDLGMSLVGLRPRLVCRAGVRRSYLKNAESQLEKMNARWRTMSKMDYRGNRDTDERFIRKRSRNIAMSVVQGSSLWETGSLTVRLSDTERGVVLDAEANPSILPTLVRRLERIMERGSALPEAPDREAAEQWLLRVRERNWKRAELQAICPL